MKPRIFISYAHKDATDFTRRLAFSLEMYASVFWDRRIQAGDFPQELQQEIESCDFFVPVMTPYSQPEEGWCRRELRIAQVHDRKIVPVRLYTPYQDEELEQKYTYADFTTDYDQGFRGLTSLILGEPISSWEYLGKQSDENLLTCLKSGSLPGLIAREIAEWVIADRLWPHIREQLSTGRIMMGTPRTAEGMFRLIAPIRQQLAAASNFAGIYMIGKTKEILDLHLSSNTDIKERDHEAAGENAAEVIEAVRKFLRSEAGARVDAWKMAELDAYFRFDVAEKLRELIAVHARRSRYLY